MTSIVLDATGKRYDIKTQPFIGDLRRLRKEFGIGYGTCVEQVAKMNLDGSNYLELLDLDGFPDAFLGWIWMLRLRSGERDVTADDVRMMELDSFHFEPDPSDDLDPDVEGAGDDDEVPTSAPTDGGRGDADEPVAGTKATPPAGAGPTGASTRTSKPRSSSGSSSSATGGQGSRRPQSGT